MANFERGQEALALLAAAPHDPSLNEATTRRSLIDGLLRDVLCWPDDQVTCEVFEEGDYFDYVLGSPDRRVVLEAKRAGRTFDVPAGVDTGVVKLSTVRDFSEANRAAVDQVLKYCQESGIELAVLSNGYQLIAFLGSRADGIKPVAGRALLFTSLEAIVEDFAQFWDCFSNEGVRSRALVRLLGGATASQPPPPLSKRISSYPGFRLGSEMETDLRILGDLFIQDVAREDAVTDEFLIACYCSSGALSQYATVSREILKTRYLMLNRLVNTEVARTKHGTNLALRDDMLAGALTKRPVVLLGDVGVGKSIFLKNLLRVEARDILGSTLVFYVDFLQHSGLFDDVADHLVRTVESVLQSDHGIDIRDRKFVRAVYNAELNAFSRGIFGELAEADPVEFKRKEIETLSLHLANKFEHVRRSLAHLEASRKLGFVIVLDNVDQHQSTFQEQIFVAGQSIAETWPVAVFMSLRPDTFHASRRAGALAAYQPRVFTVAPPRSDQVVVKRLQFARHELVEMGRLPGFPTGLTLDSENLLIYIDVLIEAFSHNNALIELVDNLSSGNTRRALDFVSTFVGSGYVQTSRILDAHRMGRSYVVPIHEFMRAILYGDQKYYDPSNSPIANLFSISSTDRKEHFLLPMLLAQIETSGERETGGFADLREVYQHLQSLDFDSVQIDFHLERGQAAGLLEVGDVDDGLRLARVTAAGSYLPKKLISAFPYIDAVVVDTPVLDGRRRPEIRDVHEIEARIDRAETFVSYLDDSWPFGSEPTPFSWPTVQAQFAIAIADVRRGASRAAERRARNRAV